jgi:hypothetical protein
MAKFRVKRVQQMVEEDFCRCAQFENPCHGIGPENVVDSFIRPPRSMRFVEMTRVEFVWMWAVFDERPGTPSGYLIVFDPRRGLYGLATKPHGRRHGTFIGFYGSTIGEAIQSM